MHFHSVLRSWHASSRHLPPFPSGPNGRLHLLYSRWPCGITKRSQRLLHKNSNPSHTPRIASKSSPKPVSLPRKPAAYEPLSQKLTLRSSPTLLYQASSYVPYMLAYYGFGGSLIAAAWFNFQTQFYVRPGGVPAFVPVFTDVGSFMIACVGIWMCLKARTFCISVFAT